MPTVLQSSLPAIGTCSWCSDDWRRNFYPEHLGQPHWLAFYSRYFRTVEVDSTFYHVPSGHALQHWLETTPDEFVFSCKMPRQITHELNLRNCDSPLRKFFNEIAPLQPKLGPILIQLPPHFAPQNDELALKTFLMKLPRHDFRFAVEFRHSGWHHPGLIHFFQKHRICWVWHDLSPVGQIDQAPFEFVPKTTDFLYIRLMGDLSTKYAADGSQLRRYGSLLWPRQDAIENWATKVRKHLSAGLQPYIYVNNHFEGSAPLSCQRLAAQFGIGISLPTPADLAPAPDPQKQLTLL